MTAGDAIALLVAVAGFLASVAITMVSVGRRDQKISTLDAEVTTMRGEVKALEKTATTHTAELAAAKDARQAQQDHHEAAVEKLEAGVAGINQQLQQIVVSLARVEAAVKRE